MLGGLLVMGGLGVVVGIGLALASKIFYVYVDPKIEAIEDVLPGANCGGCGYPGCSANAAAIVAGKSAPGSCVAAGPEVAESIAGIMGVKLEAKEPDIAQPGCRYGTQDADLKYTYTGIMDCRAAALLEGGAKVCPIGCLGLGTCVRACPFGALSMGPDNLPVVDPERCTGCGTCERVCPKHIITLSSNSRRIQNEYTTDQCTAPCQRSCPAGIDIPAYIREIGNRNYVEALRVIKQTNPFPLVCGRICVHPCELACRRNLVDEPVAINPLKRFVADYEMNSGQRVHPPRAPETGRRLAVIGGGAEGLTAAYVGNRLGHDVTVYEADAQLGGLLRIGIPENRLPRNVLNWELESFQEVGIDVRLNQRLGADITISSLLAEGNEAVIVALGGWDTHLADKRRSTGGASPLPGVRLLVDVLLEQKSGITPAVGESVLILGGGRTAFEAARKLRETGTKSVHIVFRGAWDRNVFPVDEVSAAEKDNIFLHFLTVVTRLFGYGNDLNEAELLPVTEDGSPNGEPRNLSVHALLTGAGRFPELVYVPRQTQEADSESVAWETVSPYPGPFAEADHGIFRPGEVVSDYRAVVEAIGAGRRAANSAQHFMSGEPVAAPENMIRKGTHVLSVDELEPVSETPRQRMPELAKADQIDDPSAEIVQGFTEEQALAEAKRCLQCGLICYRRVAHRTQQ